MSRRERQGAHDSDMCSVILSFHSWYALASPPKSVSLAVFYLEMVKSLSAWLAMVGAASPGLSSPRWSGSRGPFKCVPLRLPSGWYTTGGGAQRATIGGTHPGEICGGLAAHACGGPAAWAIEGMAVDICAGGPSHGCAGGPLFAATGHGICCSGCNPICPVGGDEEWVSPG